MKCVTTLGGKLHCLLIIGAVILAICNPVILRYANAIEPPSRGEIEHLRTTGELNNRVQLAKQFGNHKPDSYVLKSAINRTQRMVLQMLGKTTEEINRMIPVMAPPPAWRGMPTTGNIRIFALLIEFQDYTHTNSQVFIHNNLFGTGTATRTPFESLAAYYTRSSYQKLNLSGGTTLGWYRTNYNRANVAQTTTGREGLIKEALNYFHSQGQRFEQFDNNNDGVVDYFMVFWTGPDTGWANFWWGYQTGFSDSTYSLDGKRLGRYSWQWEARPVGGVFSPLVAIHETGHALGVPDYYDYDDSVGPRGGVGGLDMMDSNMGDHNCFSKWMLGWITSPTIIVASGSQVLTLNPSGTSEDAVMIFPNASSLFEEYFMAQTRQRTGNDSDSRMPGDGMLIWHIDAHLDASGTDFLYDNSFTAHKLLRLMEADGAEHIEHGGSAGASDYYMDGKSFTPNTSPSSNKYDNTPSGVSVVSISPPGPQMSATFAIGLPLPQLKLEIALDPSERLGKNETTQATATVTINGVAQPGRSVKFSSSAPGLASIDPPAVVTTDNRGIAPATIRGKTYTITTVRITAETEGASDSKTVNVPDFSLAGLIILVAGFLFAWLRQRYN